jgi:acetate kinase
MGSLLLAINAGSSSLKFAVHETDNTMRRVDGGKLEGIGTSLSSVRLGTQDEPEPLELPDHETALAWLLERLERHGETTALMAAGHRVVHGGLNFTAPVRVDQEAREALGELIPLAPLHQPHNLAAIDAMSRLRPKLPQVACFDTSFHRRQPELAQRYALPSRLSEAGVRAYGFHGLSYEYIAGALPQYCGDMPEKVIVAHLGNGASLCAMNDGRSVATTMGFTPLDGIPMGTRTGHLDPGVTIYLQRHLGMSLDEVEEMLYYQSGLQGVSGISSDMRRLLASEAPAAGEAVELFVYQVGRHIGSLAAALGGIDALVFTGGIGEHAAEVRERICDKAAWLGLQCDPEANRAGQRRIDTRESRVSAWVIPTDEESVIVRQTLAAVSD